MDGAVDHVRRAGVVAIALLVAIGAVSGAVRTYVILNHDAQFLLRIQKTIYGSFTRDTTFVVLWTRELVVIEERFAKHDRIMLVHAAAGGAFLLLALLQFSSRLRLRYRELHRWLGRVLAFLAIASGLAGLFFGVVIPFAGAGEVTSTGFFGALFVFAIVRAVIAIRAGRIEVHREWMIRAYAVALGISTIRIVGSLLQTFTPLSIRELIGVMFWLGWGLTLAAAEAWVRMTRAPTPRA